jgi:hypothetical protein
VLALASRDSKRISARDRARLTSNLPEDANRFAWVGDRRFPILHLSIQDFERFQGAVERLQQTMLDAVDIGWKHALFDDPDLVLDVMLDDIPRAASIALHMSIDDVKCLGGHPADLLAVVIQQWIHNLEMESLRKIFPMPPKKEEEEDLEGDPTDENPLAIIEKLSSGFHWSFEEAKRITMPQMYLLSNSSAWTWHRHDVKNPEDSTDGPVKKKKTDKPIREMTAKEYKNHVRELWDVLG